MPTIGKVELSASIVILSVDFNIAFWDVINEIPTVLPRYIYLSSIFVLFSISEYISLGAIIILPFAVVVRPYPLLLSNTLNKGWFL